MYWEPDKESMGRDELEQLQIERLQATLNRVYAHVPFYRKKFDAMGITPEDIGSLADLARLPFTTKADLRDNYPYGLFAVPMREVVRIHASSGTTGAVTVVGYTRNDIRTWSNLVARILTAGGVTKDDVVQIAFGYGLFTGAFGLHYGAERVGASVIPASSGNTERQIQIMKDFKTTALVSTPSYALQVGEKMREMGIPVSALSLRYGLFGAEPWSDAMRQEIESRLGIVATDNYGLSEVIGPGVSGECQERRGLHINEDHFLVEVIDPETLRPVPPGETGELVITPLTKEAFPMIRYRTRDVTRLLDGSVPVRSDGPPDEPRDRPHRRHADHQGSQRLSVADRARPVRDRGDGAALPDRHRSERRDGRGDGAGGGGGVDLLRSDAAPEGDGGYDPETAGARAGDLRGRKARGNENPQAVRGEGDARDRQPEAVTGRCGRALGGRPI